MCIYRAAISLSNFLVRMVFLFGFISFAIAGNDVVSRSEAYPQEQPPSSHKHGMLGPGKPSLGPSSPKSSFSVTNEELERMLQANIEIRASFNRIDNLLKELSGLKMKIKQTIENNQEMAMCAALKEIEAQINKMNKSKIHLSQDEKQILLGHEGAYKDLSGEIQKVGIRCFSVTKP